MANHKLRIGFLSTGAAIPSRMAHSVAIMQSFSELARQGADVSLVISTEIKNSIPVKDVGDIWEYYGLKPTMKILMYPRKPFFRFGIPGKLARLVFFSLIGVIKKFDFVFTRQEELAVLSFLFGKKVVLEIHEIETFRYPLILKILARLSFINRIFFIIISNSGKRKLKEYGIDEKRIHVAPSAVRLQDYTGLEPKAQSLKSNPLLPNKPILMFCGNLYRDRGIEDLLQAMIYLPDVHLVLVGGQDVDIEHYRALAGELGIDNVSFTGFVPHKKVPVYLSLADFLIMPYPGNTKIKADTSPLKMFEYMASGKPIITSDMPILREVLVEGQNAYFVEQDSPEAIVGGVNWMINNPGEAEKLGKNAAIDVKNFSWEARVKNILTWLNKETGTP